MTDESPTGASISPAPKVYLGSWRMRRRVIVSTLGFCAGEIVYLSTAASDTAIHQQIALGLIGLAATVIGSYVFGAVWDDHSIRKAGQ